MPKFYGILAYPASPSKSPGMHLAAFQELGIDVKFERYEIPADELNTFFDQHFRKEKKIEGLAVSIPHKVTVIPLLDEIDEAARGIGAVNTVFWKKEQLWGTNTDWSGFSKALGEHFDVEGQKVLVLGAGGAARAIVYALVQDQADQIIVANRTAEKARDLALHFQVQWKYSDDLRPEEYDLVVNTTPLGMKGELEKISPLPENFWRSHLTAFDIVYTPAETKFLRDARKAGATAISGEKMFVYQGMEQFRIWTGKEAPKEVMERALAL